MGILESLVLAIVFGALGGAFVALINYFLFDDK